MGDTSTPGADFCPACGAKVEASVAISIAGPAPEQFIGKYESEETRPAGDGRPDSERPAAHLVFEDGEIRAYRHADPGEGV